MEKTTEKPLDEGQKQTLDAFAKAKVDVINRTNSIILLSADLKTGTMNCLVNGDFPNYHVMYSFLHDLANMLKMVGQQKEALAAQQQSPGLWVPQTKIQTH